MQALKSSAHSRKVCDENGWPSGEDIQIDSGDYDEPEWPPELKAAYREAWQQLSDEERGLLSNYRQKYFPDNGCDLTEVTIRAIRLPAIAASISDDIEDILEDRWRQ